MQNSSVAKLNENAETASQDHPTQELKTTSAMLLHTTKFKKILQHHFNFFFDHNVALH